jgi:hypothetical protein
LDLIEAVRDGARYQAGRIRASAEADDDWAMPTRPQGVGQFYGMGIELGATVGRMAHDEHAERSHDNLSASNWPPGSPAIGSLFFSDTIAMLRRRRKAFQWLLTGLAGLDLTGLLRRGYARVGSFDRIGGCMESLL